MIVHGNDNKTFNDKGRIINSSTGEIALDFLKTPNFKCYD
jgi:hypothetical protein